MQGPEFSASGSEIFRHEPREEPPRVVGGANPVLDAVTEHVERHVGEVERVLHEVLSTTVHVDVLEVPPGEDRPFRTLVTCGMSALPMNAPSPEQAHAELLLCLPADLADDWPAGLLRSLARLPHEYDTWLGHGHTIPNGDPPEPYAPGTSLCGALIVPPVMLPKEIRVLHGDPPTTFYAVVPLHANEMELKLQHGVEALFPHFDRAGVSELLDPRRRSAIRRKRFGIF